MSDAIQARAAQLRHHVDRAAEISPVGMIGEHLTREILDELDKTASLLAQREEEIRRAFVAGWDARRDPDHPKEVVYAWKTYREKLTAPPHAPSTYGHTPHKTT